VSLVECQEIRRALEDGALDVLAPGSSSQKDVAEFRERILLWIDEFDQHLNSPGNCYILLVSTLFAAFS